MNGCNFCFGGKKFLTRKSEDGGTNWTSFEKNKKEGKALQEATRATRRLFVGPKII